MNDIKTIEQLHREHLEGALAVCPDRKSVAKALDMSTRTIQRWIKQWGLDEKYPPKFPGKAK